MREFIVLANTLAAADSRLAAEMAALAEKMKLNVYRNTDGMFIGTADDNPLTSARRRLERAVLGATTIDLSAATAKMQGLEKATYGVYQSLKEVLAAKSAALKSSGCCAIGGFVCARNSCNGVIGNFDCRTGSPDGRV